MYHTGERVDTQHVRALATGSSTAPARHLGSFVRNANDLGGLRDVWIANQSKKRSISQKIGIRKRFPQLPDDIIQSSWSGIVSRSRNSSQIFEKIDDNIFAAGCYNGSGIGVGTLFGEQIALKASNLNTNEIETIEARDKPTWLPPEPFLSLGVKTRLIYERLRARSEI